MASSSSSASNSSKKRTAKDAGLSDTNESSKSEGNNSGWYEHSGELTRITEIHPFFNKETKSTDGQHGSFQWLKSLGPKSTCYHGINLKPPSRSKVALLDLDGTIIKSNFDVTWEWWRLEVPTALKKIHDDGYSIVIISNQALKTVPLKNWKEKKIPSLAASLPSLPFRIFAATAKDNYRKPMIGMWTELVRMFREDGVEIDKSASFFVGDAAGRQYTGRKPDFSGTDRKWAMNVGIPFHTPEEYFLNLPVHTDIKLEGFMASSVPEMPPYTPTSMPLIPEPRTLEIVLFVGFPALGKTSFFNRHFKPLDYVHDMLGSRSKCIKAVEDALGRGSSCVIDNTNRNIGTRKHYIELARKHKVPIRCFHFTGSMELAWHNNLYRAFNMPPSIAINEPKRDLVPYLAFTSYKSDFQEPDLSEGFTELKQVHWVFEGDEEARRHWNMWLQLQGK